jgi:hypothetical protein
MMRQRYKLHPVLPATSKANILTIFPQQTLQALTLLIFVFLLIFFTAIAGEWGFFQKSGLSKTTLRLLFVLKLGMGCFVGWLSVSYDPQNDYWMLNRDAYTEYLLLRRQPGVFFSSIFHSNYEGLGGFFDSVGSYWNDLRYNLLIKLTAILNLISHGNYYINSIFFSFVGFTAHLALYRIYITLFPKAKMAVLIGCFLLPTMLYFSSGMHKDLIVFTLMAWYSYALFFLSAQGFSPKKILVFLFSVAGLLLMRNYLVPVILLGTVGFWLCLRLKQKPVLIFGTVFISAILAMFLMHYWLPAADPLKIWVQKQSDFLALPLAASQIALEPLQPNPMSFLQNLPQAINHGFFRPYLWDSGGRFSLLYALELFGYQVLAMTVLVYLLKKKRLPVVHPFIYYGLFIGLTMLLVTGFLIPNISSIVRYRSLYLPFLITPALIVLFSKKQSH